MKRLILPILLFCLVGCQSLQPTESPRTGLKYLTDEQAMQAEVLKYLSPGMSIEKARKFMTDSGFECSDEWQDQQCVCCHIVRCTDQVLVTSQIFVFLYHKEGKLAEVKTTCRLVGP